MIIFAGRCPKSDPRVVSRLICCLTRTEETKAATGCQVQNARLHKQNQPQFTSHQLGSEASSNSPKAPGRHLFEYIGSDLWFPPSYFFDLLYTHTTRVLSRPAQNAERRSLLQSLSSGISAPPSLFPSFPRHFLLAIFSSAQATRSLPLPPSPRESKSCSSTAGRSKGVVTNYRIID